MNITWIKCSEQMPPDDYNYTVVARADMHSGMPFLTDGGTMNKSTVVNFTEWAGYTEAALKELNK